MEDTSFLLKLEKELESSLKERLKAASIIDEDDFKDLVNEICVLLDPNLKRDQVRQALIGAYNVGFVLWNGLVAIEARLVKEKRELQQTVTELVSHIPVFCSIYRYAMFLILDIGDSIEDVAGLKKNLEEKSAQLRVVVSKKEVRIAA